MYYARTLAFLATVLLWTGATIADGEHQKPAVFQDMGFDEALELAANEDRLLLVDAWASWCGPCLAMDTDTWSDPAVEAWVREHAVAIQFDVDVDEALGEQLRIEAMPTVVVFRAGEEFDRSVGYADAAGFLEWLGAVNDGRTRADLLRDRVEANDLSIDPIAAIDERIEYALALTDAGDFDEALAEFEWLWDNIEAADAYFEGERHWYVTGEMSQLAELHPPAMQRFGEFRDEIEVRLTTGAADWNELRDWIALNSLTHEEDRTLDWARRILARENGAASLQRVEEELLDIAIKHDDWALAGNCIADPIATANSNLASIEFLRVMFHQMAAADELDGQDPDEALEWMLSEIRCDVSDIYAACLAAGRFADAEAVAAALVRADDEHKAREHMVTHAIRAEVVLPVHRQWLDDAANAGVGVDQATRDNLDRLLESAGAGDPTAGP